MTSLQPFIHGVLIYVSSEICSRPRITTDTVMEGAKGILLTVQVHPFWDKSRFHCQGNTWRAGLAMVLTARPSKGICDIDIWCLDVIYLNTRVHLPDCADRD